MAARALALIALWAGPALADYDPSQYPAYETCALCHGLDGVSRTDKFPNLAGQKKAYIEAQVTAFRRGRRANDGGQMVTIVTELHPEDIPFVANWFSTQDPPEPYEAEDTAAGAAQFADLGCGTCHYNLDDPLVPHLTAQKPGYLAKQMKDFREGSRYDPWMSPMARFLTDEDIDDLAAYFSALELPAGNPAPLPPKAQTCVACHGKAGVSDNTLWPNLAGQYARYLAKQLRDYQAGIRKDPVMAPLAMVLSKEDIDALSEYYAGL